MKNLTKALIGGAIVAGMSLYNPGYSDIEWEIVKYRTSPTPTIPTGSRQGIVDPRDHFPDAKNVGNINGESKPTAITTGVKASLEQELTGDTKIKIGAGLDLVYQVDNDIEKRYNFEPNGGAWATMGTEVEYGPLGTDFLRPNLFTEIVHKLNDDLDIALGCELSEETVKLTKGYDTWGVKHSAGEQTLYDSNILTPYVKVMVHPEKNASVGLELGMPTAINSKSSIGSEPKGSGWLIGLFVEWKF